MIIPKKDGGEIDTDKLSDGDALTVEKFEELTKFCEEHSIPFLSVYSLNNKIGHGVCQNFNTQHDQKQNSENISSMYEALFKLYEEITPGFKIVIADQALYDILMKGIK